jgi:YidC/Oxa1 family membrane protein insertase
MFSILYLGPYFNLLPIFAVALTVIQQKLMMPPPADEQQEMQQKMMKYMAVFIGIMFYKVAAGLCLYFIVSSIWGLCERKLLPKKKLDGGGPVPAVSTANSPKGPRGRSSKLDKQPKKPETLWQRFKDWYADVLKEAQKK